MSSTSQPKRTGPDNYQTPVPAIETLANFIHPYIEGKMDSLLEPCAGDGNIVRIFTPHFRKVYTCEIREGTDYLKQPFAAYSWIITNPPFTLALDFLKKSLGESENVAYLLRLNFLGAQCRREFWKKHAPGTLLVISERPSFVQKTKIKIVNGKERKITTKTDSIEYAWFIWSELVPPGIFVL